MHYLYLHNIYKIYTNIVQYIKIYIHDNKIKYDNVFMTIQGAIPG
jgi:hypothetical protein